VRVVVESPLGADTPTHPTPRGSRCPVHDDTPRASELLSYWTQLTPSAAARAVASALERERKRGEKRATSAAVAWLEREARRELGTARECAEVLNEAAAELRQGAHMEGGGRAIAEAEGLQHV